MNTVLIIDDHDIIRFGLETLIASCPQLSVIGSVSSLTEGLSVIAARQPELVICDMSMEDSKGLDTVRAVVAAQKPRACLIVSMHDEMLYGEQALALGAQGYVMKESAHSVVIPAALAVLQGQTWVSQRLNTRLLNRLVQRGRHDTGPAGRTAGADAARTLTLRELEILEQLRSGKTTKEIAFDLGLSTRTVDIHRANIKRKLGLRSGTELTFALSRV